MLAVCQRRRSRLRHARPGLPSQTVPTNVPARSRIHVQLAALALDPSVPVMDSTPPDRRSFDRFDLIDEMRQRGMTAAGSSRPPGVSG
jgi:hypothetical protein